MICVVSFTIEYIDTVSALHTGSHKIFKILKQVQYDKNFGSLCKARYDSKLSLRRIFGRVSVSETRKLSVGRYSADDPNNPRQIFDFRGNPATCHCERMKRAWQSISSTGLLRHSVPRNDM